MEKKIMYLVLFLTCSNLSYGQINAAVIKNKKLTDSITYGYLNKLFITGDFNGKGKSDTIFQNIISKSRNIPIDSFPYNYWDLTCDFFNKMNSDIILTVSDKKSDTLHLGFGKGLYCLINIGDNNHDGKDEIACVINYCDESNLNSCKIYTLCNKKWIELFEFGIHEDAFMDNNRNTNHIFFNIPCFLEKINGHWLYSDYYKQEYTKDGLKKHDLKIKGCH